MYQSWKSFVAVALTAAGLGTAAAAQDVVGTIVITEAFEDPFFVVGDTFTFSFDVDGGAVEEDFGGDDADDAFFPSGSGIIPVFTLTADPSNDGTFDPESSFFGSASIRLRTGLGPADNEEEIDIETGDLSGFNAPGVNGEFLQLTFRTSTPGLIQGDTTGALETFDELFDLIDLGDLSRFDIEAQFEIGDTSAFGTITSVTAVPEPGSALLLLGVAGCLVSRRRGV